jgi:hypothetical protein
MLLLIIQNKIYFEAAGYHHQRNSLSQIDFFIDHKDLPPYDTFVVAITS